MLTFEQKNELNKKGFLFLKKFRDDLSTKEIGILLGNIIDVEKIHPDNNIKNIQKLVPKESSEKIKNTYSSIFGYDQFPLHSDYAHWITPPRYLLLRCIVGSTYVHTRLLHSSMILNSHGDLCRKAIVSSRRKSIEQKIIPMPILFERNGIHGFRWDSIFLEKINSSAKKLNEIMKDFNNNECVNFNLENLGDLLIVDNWKTLHGRSSVPKFASDRVIERVFLNDLK